MSDSPNSLVIKPKPDTRKGGSRFLYLAIAVGVVVLGVLFYSVQFGSQPDKERKEQQQIAGVENDVADEQPALAAPDQKTGLVNPPPPPLPDKTDQSAPQDEAPLVTVVKLPPPPAAYQARQRELLQVRNNRQQALQQALAAPLKIQITKADAPAASAEAPVSMVSGVAQRHPIYPGAAALPDQTPSEREDKETFLRDRARVDQWQLPYDRVPGAAYEIKTGTVISGIMLSGINSDLPGHILAQVSRNIYDTASGSSLLVPQGSRLVGLYDSRVVYGQERVLVAWNRIIFPDGSSITLGAMPGADVSGYSGFSDQVNNHYLRIFGSAAIMSLISGPMAWAMDSFSSSSESGRRDNPSFQDQMGSAVAEQVGQASMQLLQKNTNIKPTLEIRPGYRFSMVVTKDIVFEAPYRPLPPRTPGRSHALD